MPDIETVRQFLGLAADAQTNVLNMCLKAAVKWYEKAGVPEPAPAAEGETADTDDYDFWVCNLAAYFYDNRGASGEDATIPPYILASLHQLRPVTEAST